MRSTASTSSSRASSGITSLFQVRYRLYTATSKLALANCPLLFGRKPKDKPLFGYQQEKYAFAIEVEGTKFIYVARTEREARLISGQVSPEGVGGAYSTASQKPEYDCFVVPSGSTQPLPLEEWRRQASYNLPTASAGAALPEQLSGLGFSIPVTDATTGGIIGSVSATAETVSEGTTTAIATFGWKQVVKPSSEYVLNRVRKGLELYTRGLSPPKILDIEFASALANTYYGTDRDFQPPNHPIPDADVLEALRLMERNGEIQLMGNKILIPR